MNNIGYNFYCVRMKLRSPLSTLPKGDMVWGFIASYLSAKFSEEDFLSFFSAEHPSFIISSAFQAGFLPKPVEVLENKKAMSKNDYAKMKEEKKKKFEKANQYLNFYNDKEQLVEANYNYSKCKRVSSMHVAISRFSNNALDGNLYSTDETWFGPDEKLDFYVLTEYDVDLVKDIMNGAFELGFGKRASVGYGVMEVDSVYRVECKKNTDKYMALGPCALDNCKDVNANIFVRFGKVGPLMSAYCSPYKIPVIMYDEGATFKSDENLLWVGSVLENMQDNVQGGFNIRHSAVAPVIRI